MDRTINLTKLGTQKLASQSFASLVMGLECLDGILKSHSATVTLGRVASREKSVTGPFPVAIKSYFPVTWRSQLSLMSNCKKILDCREDSHGNS